MAFVKVYLHLVWATKNRRCLLDSPEKRNQVWAHMSDNARKKGLFLKAVGGFSDHCHCLVSLGIDQTISEIVQLLKGESSHWIGRQDWCLEKFGWQDEYFALSVSESLLEKTKNYILNQEEHHRYKTFQEEYENFIEKYGFTKHSAKAGMVLRTDLSPA